MSYSFDDLLNRRGTHSVKWDLAAEDELPLWVADMDFAVPPAVSQRLKERIDHPVLGYPLLDDSYFNPLLPG